jgi:C-terminal processing protease CtpA/Prc
VIKLINEHTQSQAEDLALEFEAVTPIVFVGTPSAGADGDLRRLALAGSVTVTVTYPGYELTRADGRQLQRVGVEPPIQVAPTVAGMRAGRDEVLERALAIAARPGQ